MTQRYTFAGKFLIYPSQIDLVSNMLNLHVISSAMESGSGVVCREIVEFSQLVKLCMVMIVLVVVVGTNVRLSRNVMFSGNVVFSETKKKP